MGSRQANSTVWARWRGGNLLRPTQAGLVQQEGVQPALLVTAADTPDRGRVTLQAGSDGRDGLTGGHSQDDAGMLDLEPGQPPGSGNPLQHRQIRVSDIQGARFPTTHRSTSVAEAERCLQHTPTRNFLHDFVPDPLGHLLRSGLRRTLRCDRRR